MSKDAKHHKTSLLTLLALATLTIGCQHPAERNAANNNPPALLANNRQQPSAAHSRPQRPWPQQTRYFHNVAVNHPTLYLQGPCENTPEDGYFNTWNKQNALAMPACPAIFLANTILWPARLACTPPWKSQTSHANLHTIQPTYAPQPYDSNATQNEPWMHATPSRKPMRQTKPQQ